MAKIDVSFPAIEQYKIVVSAPMRQGVVVVKGWNIDEAEESFAKRRNHVSDSDHEQQIELDRVRALLKYAKACGAQLGEIHNANNKMSITLSFYSLTDMIDFQAEMNHAVSTATMS